jgi:SAM-dependent methyltransferase
MTPNAASSSRLPSSHPPSSRVSSFVDQQVGYDRMFEPFTGPLLDAAELSSGQRVIDIGCGAGTTTLLAADRVTPGGLAIGVDVDTDAVRRARQRADGARRHHASFIEADAATHAFEPHRADAIISRFGTLHFADPAAAFANLKRATKPGGRLALLCARSLEDNLWAKLPLDVLARLHPDVGRSIGHSAKHSGPFSLAAPDLLHEVIAAGGYEEIGLRPLSADLLVGADVDATLAFFDATDGTRLRRVLGDAYPAYRNALGEALAAHLHDDGVRLPGSVWLATAVSWG